MALGFQAWETEGEEGSLAEAPNPGRDGSDQLHRADASDQGQEVCLALSAG